MLSFSGAETTFPFLSSPECTRDAGGIRVAGLMNDESGQHPAGCKG